MAERFAGKGMKVVLADRDEHALKQTAATIVASGAQAIAVGCDVTRPEQVENLADRAYEAFGTVHLLCNNAGVLGRILPSWEQPLANWDWVFGVNVKGIINGQHFFVPRMLKQDSEAYVLNTCSIAGMINGPFFAPYNASKHAALSITECLHHELRQVGSKIEVGALCPGWVNTGLAKVEEKLPEELYVVNQTAAQAKIVAERDQSVRKMVSESISPEEIADIVVAAIEEGRFWIFPHPERKADAAARMDEIQDERIPGFPAKARSV